jgi:hypothetical protein
MLIEEVATQDGFPRLQTKRVKELHGLLSEIKLDSATPWSVVRTQRCEIWPA